MPLTFKLSSELFYFNDEEFLTDLERVSLYYDKFVVLEYKEKKQKISKEFESLHDAIKGIDIQFGNIKLYKLDVPALKQIFKERNL
jgi:hypothetical protein